MPARDMEARMGAARERILDYLEGKPHATAREIAEELGLNYKSLCKTLVRMDRTGEVVRPQKGLWSLVQLSEPNAPAHPPVAHAPVRRDRAVPQWNAGIEYDTEGGELRTVPLPVYVAAETTPDEAAMFEEFGLDPAQWRITNIRRSKWQNFSGEWLEAYKASFTRRSASALLAPLTNDELAAALNTGAYSSPIPRNKNRHATIMAPIGDTQLGKPDGGGTAATVERFARLTDQLSSRLEQIDGARSLILPWLGDCLEGLVSQGGRNVARLDLSITEQVRVYRRLMLHQIATLAPLADQILIPVVPGNHDETTRDQTMAPSDSWAIEGASAVADALALAGGDLAGKVHFLFPEAEELGVTVNVGDTERPYVIHFTHGHTARSSAKMLDWWKAQSHGRQAAGAADMLVTAHWHHLRLEQTGGNRTWLQLPAMDGGSDWFRRRTGEEVVSGMVSMEITGTGIGFRDLDIHS